MHIIGGDFSHVELKTVLPKFYQHVYCPTRGERTLDNVTNIKHGYRAMQLPHLGQSDHLLLAPAYTPLKKQAVITKTVKTWPEGASHQLQDCFERTDWKVFDYLDLEEHTAAVLGYVKHCTDTVAVDKRIWVHPNQKPWMTREVQRLLRERNKAFRLGDRQLYSAARASLKRGIRWAKLDFRQRIESDLRSNNIRQLWCGIQNMTNHRPNAAVAEGDQKLAEHLNLFFARFEVEPPEGTALPTPTLTVEEHEVRCTLRAVNIRKAGPDGIAEGLRRPAARGLHQDLQPVSNEVHCSSVSEVSNHYPSPQKIHY